MRISDSLQGLIDHGVLDDVIRPLMAGKEAQVFLVISGGEQRVAKVYKEAQDRTFQARAQYTEGRRVRNSRDQRAMNKGSRYGRAQNEAAWRSTEVDMIYRLHEAGVRVPTPYHFIDGVFIMELVRGVDGGPAPRLGEVPFSCEEATQVFARLLRETVRMLSAGVVHGDLSDFNVLMASDGPVIIDLPQAVNAASNQNARKLLLRDVDNLQRFLARFVPGHRPLPYAQEMWDLYERGDLKPDTVLTGHWVGSAKPARTHEVLALIGDAERDEQRRRQNMGVSMRGTGGTWRGPQRPKPQVFSRASVNPAPSQANHARTNPGQSLPPGNNANAGTNPKRRRRRRRGRGGSGGGQRPSGPAQTSFKRS